MKKLLLIIILLLGSLYSENNKLDKKFFNMWVFEPYQSGIENGIPPLKNWEKFSFHIYQIFVDKNSNKVVLGSFGEIVELEYEILSIESIKVGQFVLTIDKDYLILKTDDNSIYRYSLLGEPYNKPDGINRYLNDKFFTGIYHDLNNENISVQFYTDGKVSGIEGVRRYDIRKYPIESPKFESVYLSDSAAIKFILHWKKDSDRLLLYKTNLSEFDPSEIYSAKIQEKFLELIKVQ